MKKFHRYLSVNFSQKKTSFWILHDPLVKLYPGRHSSSRTKTIIISIFPAVNSKEKNWNYQKKSITSILYLYFPYTFFTQNDISNAIYIWFKKKTLIFSSPLLLLSLPQKITRYSTILRFSSVYHHQKNLLHCLIFNKNFLKINQARKFTKEQQNKNNQNSSKNKQLNKTK